MTGATCQTLLLGLFDCRLTGWLLDELQVSLADGQADQAGWGTWTIVSSAATA